MRSYEGDTQKLGSPSMPRTVAPHRERPAWQQIALNVAYVLAAGPRGLLYLLVLALGLMLDLPHLALRLVLGTAFGLLHSLASAAAWLFRFGPRFLWIGTIVGLAWVIQTILWLIVAGVRALARTIVSVLTDIIHPRSAWERAVYSVREERARTRGPRVLRGPRLRPGAITLRWRGARLVDTWAAGLHRLRHQEGAARWMVTPRLWRHLALWERSHTGRWLNIDLPPLGPPGSSPVSRAARLSSLPLASLGYVLLKLPLGLMALAPIAVAAVIGEGLLESHNPTPVVGVVLLTVAALHLLAQSSARYASRAFSPSEATRRLHAAEALAAQERGKAERAEQSRRDLIINVGHELRTPTASILGHVESIMLALDTPDGRLPPETLRSYLDIVQREAGRLSSLVDDLLAVASAERAELQLMVAPVDGVAVIDEVYQALAPLARRDREVMLVHESQPDLPPLLADRQRLSQVLFNLVRNAITYTPPGGIVSITLTRVDSDRLRLTVADTGSGITPDDLERVFDRFYRTDASRARESGGFGLGLAIARDLVEAMGGTITADSTVGEGSAFHVWLPIANADPLLQATTLSHRGASAITGHAVR